MIEKNIMINNKERKVEISVYTKGQFRNLVYMTKINAVNDVDKVMKRVFKTVKKDPQSPYYVEWKEDSDDLKDFISSQDSCIEITIDKNHATLKFNYKLTPEDIGKEIREDIDEYAINVLNLLVETMEEPLG